MEVQKSESSKSESAIEQMSNGCLLCSAIASSAFPEMNLTLQYTL